MMFMHVMLVIGTFTLNHCIDFKCGLRFKLLVHHYYKIDSSHICLKYTVKMLPYSLDKSRKLVELICNKLRFPQVLPMTSQRLVKKLNAKPASVTSCNLKMKTTRREFSAFTANHPNNMAGGMRTVVKKSNF